MYHPTRGGTRGGKDQFQWENVKSDKDRENYLGHSVMAPVGRWQKGKDLTWYAKDKKSKAAEEKALKDEIQRVKAEEERLIQEALGIVPKREEYVEVGSAFSKLEKQEADQLFERRGKEEKEEMVNKGERVQGVGFSPIPSLKALMVEKTEKTQEKLEGTNEDLKDKKSESLGSSDSEDSLKGEGKQEVVSGEGEKSRKRERKPHSQKKEERRLRKEKSKVKEGKKAEKRRKREERKERKKARREERQKKEESEKPNRESRDYRGGNEAGRGQRRRHDTDSE